MKTVSDFSKEEKNPYKYEDNSTNEEPNEITYAAMAQCESGIGMEVPFNSLEALMENLNTED